MWTKLNMCYKNKDGKPNLGSTLYWRHLRNAKYERLCSLQCGKKVEMDMNVSMTFWSLLQPFIRDSINNLLNVLTQESQKLVE
jgi:hypothetical protein